MQRAALVLFLISSGLFAGLLSRYAALLLYLWIAMFRPVEWLWVDISSFRPSLIAGLVLVLPCLLTGIFPVGVHPLSIGALLFLGAGGVAQLGAVDPNLAWTWLSQFARILLVSLLIPPLATTPRRVQVVLGVIAGSLLLHSAKAGVVALLTGAHYNNGLAGSFNDNNGYALGTVMAMFLMLAVAESVSSRLLRWGLYVAAGPLSAMTVISLFSRGAFLALAVGTFAFVLLLGRLRTAGAMVIVLVLVLLVQTRLPEGYGARLATLSNPQELARSEGGRLHFWSVALTMAAARPLGVGMRNFEVAYEAFDTSNGRFGFNRAVHNSFLQALTETGFAGLAAYVFVMGWTIVVLFRIRARGDDERLDPDARLMCRSLANGMIASMVAFLVGGTFLAMALNDLTWLTVGVVIALDRMSATFEPVKVQHTVRRRIYRRLPDLTVGS